MSETRTLLVGHGAREAALAAAIAGDSQLFSLARFQNPTLQALSSELRVVSQYAVPDVVRFANDVRPDFVMIGSEDILALGVADELSSAGFWTCGPSKAASRLEWDKLFARRFLERNLPALNIPYFVAENTEDVQRFFSDPEWPVAVKPIGLTGGKGVRVQDVNLASNSEAADYAKSLIASSGRPVLLERRISGVEFTLHCLTDGQDTVFFRATYDYSYRESSDSGPQTGGMGSYCDAKPNLPFMTENEYRRSCDALRAVIAALGKEGTAYEGILQGQFFLCSEGIKICEFACRFGDPEATNLLPTLVSPWVQVMANMKSKNVSEDLLEALPAASVTVCLVPPSYPAKLETPQGFILPMELLAANAVKFFPGACQQDVNGYYRCFGGRAGSLTSESSSIESARAQIVKVLPAIHDLQYRTDIAESADIKAKIDLADRVRQTLETREAECD